MGGEDSARRNGIQPLLRQQDQRIGVQNERVPGRKHRLQPIRSALPASQPRADQNRPEPAIIQPMRSEEHTSELQSLMRISYAVFCLKKKKKTESQLT